MSMRPMTLSEGASRETGGDDEDPLALERELVERARGGDRHAFDLLVEAHVSRTWRVVWRILRHREDTEDVVQEVFFAAYQALPSYRGESRFSTWLHRIAVTRALNHLDHSAEKLRRASRPLDPLQELNHMAAGDGPSPIEALEAAELAQRLEVCLSRLPAAWRAVVALRDGEDLSYEEIARAVGVALGTVRSRLARARLALRRCIEVPS